MYASPVTPYTLTLTSTSSTFDFTGIYTRKTSTAEDMDWYVLGASTGNFSKRNAAGQSLNPFRFFLKKTDRENPYTRNNAPSNAIEIRAFGDATEIQQLMSEANEENAVIYDLQGRRITEPASGIYVVNGKKMLVK